MKPQAWSSTSTRKALSSITPGRRNPPGNRVTRWCNITSSWIGSHLISFAFVFGVQHGATITLDNLSICWIHFAYLFMGATWCNHDSCIFYNILITISWDKVPVMGFTHFHCKAPTNRLVANDSPGFSRKNTSLRVKIIAWFVWLAMGLTSDYISWSRASSRKKAWLS